MVKFLMGSALGFLVGGVVIISNPTLESWFHSVKSFLMLKVMQLEFQAIWSSPTEMLWALSCITIIIWVIISLVKT